MPDKLKTAYEGENFQLYRIIKPGMDKNAGETPKKPIRLNPAAAAAAAGQPAPADAKAAVVPAPEPRRPSPWRLRPPPALAPRRRWFQTPDAETLDTAPKTLSRGGERAVSRLTPRRASFAYIGGVFRALAHRTKAYAMAAVSPLAPPSLPEHADRWEGVRFASGAAGIRYKGRTDVLLAVFDEGTQVAGVFTTLQMSLRALWTWCRARPRRRPGAGAGGRQFRQRQPLSPASVGVGGDQR